jgi:hypothetical protein
LAAHPIVGVPVGFAQVALRDQAKRGGREAKSLREGVGDALPSSGVLKLDARVVEATASTCRCLQCSRIVISCTIEQRGSV